MNFSLSGIAASNGIAIAKAFRLENPELTVEKTVIIDIEAELARFESAVTQSKSELETIKEQTSKQISDEEAAIFSAHLLVLSDPELLGPITDKIKSEKVNAEFALQETSNMFIGLFESMDNDYMKERAADIRDVTKRVLAHLLGVSIQNPSMIADEVIIIAEDLTPSDTVQLNPQFVKGFITDIGGRTSHSAILARTLEIPAVVGAKTVMSSIENGSLVIVDGLDGNIIVNPDVETIAQYEEKKANYEQQKSEWARLKHEATITADGHHVELGANIGTPNDVVGVIDHGGEAIGLYRTEFLYMGRSQFPTEDEQTEAYASVLKQMNGKPTVVRTLDIGGDKELSYLQLPKELNPFLGLRAIRLCLEMKDMFRTQLRALLRASIHGNLKIMFPMIATLEEFRQAKALFLEEKAKLEEQGVEVSNSIEVGIMVEIPSTAVMADVFAKEVDFFSIGTNDLIQYTLAADRMNERVSYLYQPFNPAILRLVKNVIDASHKEGKWTGMCGEMAGDEIAIPILLGMGLDEFSMSASSILKARSQISKLSKAELESHIETILTLSTSEEVVSYVKKLTVTE
ncbi:phosphoenolpyruvate--protein phosphotransferase [Paenisporosarcina quisquiliarum]|uniref:Phosphoenolpyruvate-protein phosphotransferase n=1 Tax=Paenisporosarcina quisquiliarum TaxID=365346 RepID=A0A9X3RBT4_9BACL|nr:phosphoenolpyruvate--protein phosphotransferase [Paenisporosarcina quisquiliarum]MCZ8535950.1 phosphoenolpyruvate--protein phosphotransferase [Paenisporosarcina quisquiliarum]